MFDFGVDFLAKEVKRAAAFHSKVLVLHPGSSLSAGVEEAVEQIAKGLNQVLNTDDSEVRIALETMAGKGSEVGRNFEELQMIYDKVERKDRLRVCFDTCHVFDAGYDIVKDLDGVLTQFDKVIGLNRLKAVHINDTMNPFSQHKDRHQKIGQGYIGVDAFSQIINHPALRKLPFYLETPNELEGYQAEIALLKNLYRE